MQDNSKPSARGEPKPYSAANHKLIMRLQWLSFSTGLDGESRCKVALGDLFKTVDFSLEAKVSIAASVLRVKQTLPILLFMTFQMEHSYP